MEKHEFQPTKILLIFWLIGVVAACIPIGGIITGFFVETNITWQNAFAIGYLIPFVILITYLILFFHTIRYELDERYVTKSSGVLWKKRRSIPLEKITNIDVRQGPFERIFGYGKIWVFTPSTGASTPEEKLVGIVRPYDLKQTILERSEAAKQSKPATATESQVEPIKEVVTLLADIRESLRNIESSLSQQKKDS